MLFSGRRRALGGVEPPDDDGDLAGRGEVVLVVEDEDGIREVARRVLVRGGYEVLTAPGGPEALALVHEHEAGPIKLFITDVIMPRMMGHGFAGKIAALFRPSTRNRCMSATPASRWSARDPGPAGRHPPDREAVHRAHPADQGAPGARHFSLEQHRFRLHGAAPDRR